MSCILQLAEHQAIDLQILEASELGIPDTIYVLICTSVKSNYTLAGVEELENTENTSTSSILRQCVDFN